MISIGPLHDPVTWYKIIHTGEQVAQRDFQNKGRTRWTGTSCIVLEVPLRNLLTSICDFVPCDWIVQRAYCSRFWTSLTSLWVNINTSLQVIGLQKKDCFCNFEYRIRIYTVKNQGATNLDIAAHSSFFVYLKAFSVTPGILFYCACFLVSFSFIPSTFSFVSLIAEHS